MHVAVEDPPTSDREHTPRVWRAHPARERPAAALAVIAVIAAFAWLAAEWMDSAWWAVFAAVALLAALHSFFFPSEYRLDGEGIELRHGPTLRRLNWSDIRRFDFGRRAGLLSTRSRASLLDLFTAMHVLFPRDHRPVVEAIRSRLSLCRDAAAAAVHTEVLEGRPCAGEH
ncbi:MAG: hypothetical protein KY476_19915 [Planctomycetes bacterium]|nr:hypothetical protein [Planctomycetota bacterium]